MLFDQSADAFAFVSDHRRKQLKGKLSATVAQAMHFGGFAPRTQ
jgi:hypothetical protein